MTDLTALKKPDIKISVRQTFGVDTDMEVDAFSNKNEFVPRIDQDYKFDRDTTLAVLSGFAFNKRVLIQGYHGTGKSTHIEQVAARLNWPCVRVNLDSHVSRIDLIGKDAIVLKDGKQVTEFKAREILHFLIKIKLFHNTIISECLQRQIQLGLEIQLDFIMVLSKLIKVKWTGGI